MARFNQAAYWARRGDAYLSEFAEHSEATDAAFRRQEEEVARAISHHDLSGVTSVLEIGCGFGRLTPILLDAMPNVTSYTGVDVSEGQVQAASARFDAGIDHRFVIGDFQVLQLEPVDLVLAGEVFLHFPPNKIAEVVAKALSLGDTLVHLDPYRPLTRTRGAGLRWHLDRIRQGLPRHATDWQHDFPRLYPDRKVTIHPILDASQHLFVAERV